jgi:hypothetical protein
MVLLRSQGELLLLVSGLRTKRQDKDRRYIRNSIAWVGEKTDEPILRKIAALVLKNNLQILELENVVSESSNSSAELFEVNWQVIEQLTPPNIIDISNSPQENGKIALFSEQPKQQLVDELKKCALPARDGALVAVTTGFKPKAIFVRANVWRGLLTDTSISPEKWYNLLDFIPDSYPSNRNKPTKDNAENDLDRAVNNVTQMLSENFREDARDIWSNLKKNSGVAFFIFIAAIFFVLTRR